MTTAALDDVSVHSAPAAIGPVAVTVSAHDETVLTSQGGDVHMMPGTPLVTIAAALAWNLLNRTTSATVTDSTIAVTGDVLVSATDGAVLTSTTQAAAIAERDLAVVSSDAVALAALFAANVVRGAVTAAVMGGSVSGADVTIQALAEQAVIDATSQVSAAAGPGTASLSVLPAASLGVAI